MKTLAPEERRPKVSITLSPGLLAKVDAKADELELSRSTIIQFALRRYFDAE